MPLKQKNKNSKSAAARPQPFQASGNTLRSVVLMGLLVAIVPVMLGVAYLALVREPANTDSQLSEAAQSYASQGAARIHALLNRIDSRIEAAASSPLAAQALAGNAQQALDDTERTLLSFFPEASSISLVPLGEMGTATFSSGNDEARNHIELDLLRRTSRGEQAPPEAYQHEGTGLTSIARSVGSDEANQQAVMLITFNNSLLQDQLNALDSDSGQFRLEQVLPASPDRTTTVAQSGNGDLDTLSATFSVPQSQWQVTFTPSRAFSNRFVPSPVTLFAVLGLVLVAVIAGFALVLVMFPKRLVNETRKITAAADKRTSVELAIPELVPLARELRRATLRGLRRAGPETEEEKAELDSDVFADPAFGDTGSYEVLELDGQEQGGSAAENDPDFPSHIFRAYDIRGLADDELDDEMVAKIGGAIATLADEQDEQTLIVGCDGRTSSPRIKSTLIKALMSAGRDVIDIGVVPTPLLYFATRHLDCRSGVMVTGSHNPAEFNGFKVVINQQTIAAGGIADIRDRVKAGRFSKGQGRVIREDVSEAYIDEVMSDIAIAESLKIVVDAGNGATSKIGPALFEALGCEVLRLHCELDGRFPNHPPDTSDEANREDLVATARNTGADFGVAFDGDGDRLAVVTGTGQIVRSDTLMMVFSEDVVSRNPGADVVFDVKCSRHLAELITRCGGRPIPWKTGHAFMKEKMQETGALLGGEFSGHIFFGERWYGFDDGMYAAGRLAEILATGESTLDEALASFPSSINTPEILVPVPEAEKFRLINNLAAAGSFSLGKVSNLDGVRVDFPYGWGLVRASNTSAALTARFEADSAEELESIQQEFRTQLLAVDPELSLTF